MLLDFHTYFRIIIDFSSMAISFIKFLLWKMVPETQWSRTKTWNGTVEFNQY